MKERVFLKTPLPGGDKGEIPNASTRAATPDTSKMGCPKGAAEHEDDVELRTDDDDGSDDVCEKSTDRDSGHDASVDKGILFSSRRHTSSRCG
jgi:hypothetical protein